MKALQWFMKVHTSISPVLQPEYLRLARFVLENNYERFSRSAVTYATIFMIWLETLIIYRFREHIVLYKR